MTTGNIEVTALRCQSIKNNLLNQCFSVTPCSYLYVTYYSFCLLQNNDNSMFPESVDSFNRLYSKHQAGQV